MVTSGAGERVVGNVSNHICGAARLDNHVVVGRIAELRAGDGHVRGAVCIPDSEVIFDTAANDVVGESRRAEQTVENDAALVESSIIAIGAVDGAVFNSAAGDVRAA